MKIIIFGLGSIGRRHARLLKDKYSHDLYAFRSDPNTKGNELGIKEIFSLDELDSIQPDIAFITNPTSEHIETAIECAKRGMHLFLEKPLSNADIRINELIDIVNKKKLKLYVAYCLRHNHVIKWLKEYLEKNKQGKPIHITCHASSYLPNWRPGSDHLKQYSSNLKLGGGVILDYSHEIDYLTYLFGSINDIKSHSARAGNVTVDTEDFADILCTFNNNTYGNIHLDFFSRLNRREIIIDYEDITIIADIINNQVQIISDEGSNIKKLPGVKEDMYLEQLQYFFKFVDKGSEAQRTQTIEDILNVFSTIMKIIKQTKQSSGEKE
ncbi:Gfo/Idh/MocA family oxidoreductase [Candidatus Woesearchaeota archaeon]|nr:Gfo/Idh/MocA family oxidoreductase [Candidatus Woesearchaeota archaeon]